MAAGADSCEKIVAEKLDKLRESWSATSLQGTNAEELQALQDARLQAWLSTFVTHSLPRQLAESSGNSEQCAALAQAAIGPLEACILHQADVVLGFWDKAVPEVSSAVAAAASLGRASPAATARTSQAAAQFLASLATGMLGTSFLTRVFRSASGTGARLPPAATLSALWSFPARVANVIGTLDTKYVPACVAHEALGGSFSEALLGVLWESAQAAAEGGHSASAPAPAAVRNLKAACVRIRQSGWSAHLAGAAASAFLARAAAAASEGDGGGNTQQLLQAHATVSACLWDGATKAQCERAVMHLLHSPPAALPEPLASRGPVCSLPVFRGVGPACSVLGAPSALAGTLKRSIPQRHILTAYGARQWLLYCSSGAAPLPDGEGDANGAAALKWQQCFDTQALADAWSLPLSVAALDTDLQQSMTGLLAFVVRNAPPQFVLLGTPLGTSLMRGVQERLGAPNLRVKAAGMLIGSVLSRAAAAASQSVLGVELPVLDWSAAVSPEIQSEDEKRASKAAADAAAQEAYAYLHLPLGDTQAAQNAVVALRNTWRMPALPTGLPSTASSQALSAPKAGASSTSGDAVAVAPGTTALSTQQQRRQQAAVVQFEHDPRATLATPQAPPAEFPDDAPRDEPAVLLGQALPQGGEGGGASPPPATAMAFALRMAQATQRDKASPGSAEHASVAAEASGVFTADGFTRAMHSAGADRPPPAPALADHPKQKHSRNATAQSTAAAARMASNVPAAKYGQLPAPPSHLREIMKTLRDPPDYKHYISALAAVGPLVRALAGASSSAHEIHDTAVPLLRVLLGASNQFGLAEFAEWQQDALVAVTECSPILAAQWLTRVVFAQEQLLGVRVQVLHVLATAALALSNTLPPASRAGAGTAQASAGDDASVNALIEELVQHAGGEGGGAAAKPALPAAKVGAGGVVSDGGRTRRWGQGAAKARRQGASVPRVNAFAGVAGEFVLPLLRRVMDPSSGVNVLGVDGAQVLAALCRTLALMLEAAGSAPNISMLCGEVLHFARAVHTHDSSGVRVGVLCIVLACAETVHRLQLQEHSMPAAGSSFLAAAVGGGVGQDAELMRSALGEASPGEGALTARAGGATAAVTRQLHGTRTLISSMAQRRSADVLGGGGGAGGGTQGEALQELAAWVSAVATHDPDAECRALAQRVAASASLQQLAHAQSTMVSLLSMLDA